MTVPVINTRERRVTNTQQWIDGICQRFSDATGWPLTYVPVKPGESARAEAELRKDPEFCWLHEIHDGQRCTGFVQIRLRDDSSLDRSFVPACDLAEAIAQLTQQLLSSGRQLDTRTREVSTLVDIGLSIPQEDDLLSALKQLLRASVQLTAFRATGFFLLDPTADELNLRVSHHLDAQQIPHPRRDLASDPPDIMALVRGTVLIQRDTSPDLAGWLPAEAAIGLCVAVQSESGPIGTLWCFDRRTRLPSERERHVLESLAAQIASVLERVVLLRESETQQRLQRELRVVSEHQAGTFLSPLPPGWRLDVAGRCRAAYELGGDLCELIPLGKRQAIVAIGDASGDGIPASVVMTAVRGALRALISGPDQDVLDTELITSRINLALHGITPAHQFMSFLYGVLNTETLTFTYTNAGHPPPIFVRGGSTSSLISHGMLLGVAPDVEYIHSVVSLDPGDMLVLFSDGIAEAMSPTRQMFGSQGIISAVKSHLDGTAQDVLDAIWQKYAAHSAGGSKPDDRTLLVIRVLEQQCLAASPLGD